MDIGCERSNWADCGDAIARSLGMSYAFVAEFEETHSPLRTSETQGGGVHGQAVLSRYPMSNVRAVVHSHQPVDWDAEGYVFASTCERVAAFMSRLTTRRVQGGAERAAEGEACRARRRSGAASAAGAPACVQLAPGGVHRHHRAAHAVHWCSASMLVPASLSSCRLTHSSVVMTDVLNDARMVGRPAHQVIMGDLNTMAHRHATATSTRVMLERSV